MDLPIQYKQDQSKRIAARFGLHFHIDEFGYLTEHAGWKSETRRATDEELQMWELLVPGWRSVKVLDVTPDELMSTLWWRTGPVYLNPLDIEPLLYIKGFEAELDREELKDGRFGKLENAILYVVREVPHGYFYWNGRRVEPWHWQPPEGERTLRPELDADVQFKLQMGLEPLMIYDDVQATMKSRG